MKYFNRKISIIFLLTLTSTFFGFYEISAQDAKPTPTPVAKKELKTVKDTQNVKPEKLGGVPDIAPTYKSKERDLPDLGRVGVEMMSQNPLSLRGAIVKALENNKDIEVSRKDVKIAEFDLKAADGGYEPRFTGRSFFERATSPNISVFSSNKTTTNDSISSGLQYQGFVKKYGTTYTGEFTNQRLKTTNPISILSPQDNTSFSISIIQPLFRGRKFGSKRRLIEIAKRNLSLTDTQFRQKAIEITVNVQRAYWDLTFALKNLQVQRDGVRDAKEQLAHNKRLVKEGTLAPVDVIAAETQVANFELSVYSALETVNRAENLLKNLIAGNRNDRIWNEAIIPTDSVKLRIPRTTLKEGLSLALANRPELEINRVAGKINKIDQKFYREQDKPQIDLTASYTSSGVSGSFNRNFNTPFLPSACNQDRTSPACLQAIALLNTSIRQNALTFTGGLQSTYTDIFLNRYPTYRVGVTFNLPLFGNRTMKANLGKTLVQASKINVQRERLEQVIQMDVRNALQSIRTSEARLRAAAISRENSERQYASEKRKLEVGKTDIYKVLERQTALMNARSVEIQAQTQLNKAIAELQHATGNSLKANDVETRLRK